MNKITRIYKNIRYVTAYIGRRQIPTIAASGAFWFFLSLVPLVITTVSLLPYTSVTQEQLMDVTDAGMVRVVTLEQLPKAWLPMVVRLSGSLISSSA